MKKIISIVFSALLLVTSTFAVEFSIGARGSIGGSVGNIDPSYDGVVYGGAFYANLNIFNGFGIQGEIDIVSNSISTGENSITFKPCEIIDFPLMAWYNYRKNNFTIGGGIGLNFSIYSDDSYRTSSNSKTNLGIALGTNLKFHFTEMFGLVLGVNSVFDFMPTEKIQSSNGEVTIVFGTKDRSRKAFYGSVGIELKLF